MPNAPVGQAVEQALPVVQRLRELFMRLVDFARVVCTAAGGNPKRIDTPQRNHIAIMRGFQALGRVDRKQGYGAGSVMVVPHMCNRDVHWSTKYQCRLCEI